MIMAGNKLKKDYLQYRLNYLENELANIPTASWERTKAQNIQVLCDNARIEELKNLLELPTVTEFEVVTRYKELESKPRYNDYEISSKLIELIDLLPENHWFRKEKETVVDENNTVSAKEFAI